MKLKQGLLIVLGVLLAILAYRLMTGISQGDSRSVPDRLHGVWVTTNQNYSDRFLKLGENYIEFGTGGVDSQRFEVTGFGGTRDDRGRELNTIYFRGVDGSKFSREFVVSMEGTPRLVFKNQPEVEWSRQ